ncbi:hypothetical protein [Lactiplantibacillus carotarum]|uniref:hypothetical protein n=1 Tax=Lactiplantibacillus carotarum TaxID=2993456 RepID=UPI00298EFF4B|nr:hypothetical protein [Lactiplantibacillus carotarum]
MKKFIAITALFDLLLVIRVGMTLLNQQVVISNWHQKVSIIVFWVAVIVLIGLNREVWHRVHYEKLLDGRFLGLIALTGALMVATLFVRPQYRPRATMQPVSIARAYADVKKYSKQNTEDFIEPIYFYAKDDSQTKRVAHDLNRIMTEDTRIRKCQLVGKTKQEKSMVVAIKKIARIKSNQAVVFLNVGDHFYTINQVQTSTGIKRVMNEIRKMY